MSCMCPDHLYTELLSLSFYCRKTDKELTALEALTIGATARSFTACCFIPITVVKTRFEVGLYYQELLSVTCLVAAVPYLA